MSDAIGPPPPHKVVTIPGTPDNDIARIIGVDKDKGEILYTMAKDGQEQPPEVQRLPIAPGDTLAVDFTNGAPYGDVFLIEKDVDLEAYNLLLLGSPGDDYAGIESGVK